MGPKESGGRRRRAVAGAVLVTGLAAVPVAAAPATAAAGDPYARLWSGCQKAALVAGSDGATHFRACFRETALVAIEEQPEARPRPPRLRYFYADGRPAALRGATPAAGGATAVPVAIDWRADGTPIRAVRIEHFGEVRLSDTEVRAARARAEALAAAAAPLGVKP